VHRVLQILETGSLNELVRDQLSEKKKIKDLFLVVIRSVDIGRNRKLASSLIQFVSNLCYGTGKFRSMLRVAEGTQEFFATLRIIILSTVRTHGDLKEDMADKVLLKHAVLGFIGNLCVDP